jgi:hypothetical protein
MIVRFKQLFLLTSFATFACAAAPPLLEYKTKSDVTLPPLSARKILGTWLTTALPPAVCTRSFEQVRGGKVYDVTRCSDGSGGNDGRQLAQVTPNKFQSRTSTSGDHYVILKSGELSVRDKSGEVGLEARHASLWPVKAGTERSLAAGEGKKTVGLECYVVGYRFGYTGTRAMKGRSTDSAWDFATPERCKADPETQRGIRAGTHAAW